MKIILDSMCCVCERWFVYSDPRMYEFDDGTQSPKYGLCQDCWEKIGKKFSSKNKT
jgi:hypothetical protein